MTEKPLTPIARALRRRMTDAETLLWSRLRNKQLGAKFTRQFPIGPYVVDFACRGARLIVELDGGQRAINAEADAERTRALEAFGHKMARIWNNQVFENLEGVLESICSDLQIARNGEAGFEP